MNIKHNLSNNLRYLREKKGLSLQQLSSEIGINKQSLYNYENGVSPSVEYISRLSEYFKITVDSLINSDLEKNDKTKKDGSYNEDNGIKSIINDLIDRLKNSEQKNDNILRELEETKEITNYTVNVLKSFADSSVIDYLDLENSIGSLTDLFSDITVNIVKYPKMLKIIKYLNVLNQQEDNEQKNKSLDKILDFVKSEVEIATKK